MSSDFLGGGLVFALAAALWIVYLIPTYFRRKNFVATERNAVRLQQTIRALAETADVPEEVRVEASARAVIEQKKVLRQAESAARANVRAAAGRAVGYDDAVVKAAQKARRNRLISALFLLATVIGIAVGISLLATGGSWETLAISCLAFAVALGIQESVVSSTQVLSHASTNRFASDIFDHGGYVAPSQQRSWTPQPLPKPLHLSEGTLAQAVVQSQIAAERMRYVAAESALIERVSLGEAGLEGVRAQARAAAVPDAQAQPAVSNRLAGMGVIEQTESAQIDLDAVLARRRAS
jgi:hypothetical protein